MRHALVSILLLSMAMLLATAAPASASTADDEFVAAPQPMAKGSEESGGPEVDPDPGGDPPDSDPP